MLPQHPHRPWGRQYLPRFCCSRPHPNCCWWWSCLPESKKFFIPYPDRSGIYLRIAKGWLGDDEVRKIAAKLLNKVKHVHTSRLLRRKNSLKLKENLTGWSPAPASKSRSIPSAPYCFQWATWSINELVPATQRQNLQRHVLCCLLAFQPSPRVWIHTVLIPGGQGGFSPARIMSPANCKDNRGVTRNCPLCILTSSHCYKIIVYL